MTQYVWENEQNTTGLECLLPKRKPLKGSCTTRKCFRISLSTSLSQFQTVYMYLVLFSTSSSGIIQIWLFYETSKTNIYNLVYI